MCRGDRQVERAPVVTPRLYFNVAPVDLLAQPAQASCARQRQRTRLVGTEKEHIHAVAQPWQQWRKRAATEALAPRPSTHARLYGTWQAGWPGKGLDGSYWQRSRAWPGCAGGE